VGVGRIWAEGSNGPGRARRDNSLRRRSTRPDGAGLNCVAGWPACEGLQTDVRTLFVTPLSLNWRGMKK